MKKLSKHNGWHVRCFVAENSHTPLNILVKLAKDKQPEVRLSALRAISLRTFK